MVGVFKNSFPNGEKALSGLCKVGSEVIPKNQLASALKTLIKEESSRGISIPDQENGSQKGMEDNFDTLERDKKRFKLEKDSKVFGCLRSGCFGEFSGRSELKKHVKDHKNVPPNTCPECGLVFITSMLLRNHKGSASCLRQQRKPRDDNQMSSLYASSSGQEVSTSDVLNELLLVNPQQPENTPDLTSCDLDIFVPNNTETIETKPIINDETSTQQPKGKDSWYLKRREERREERARPQKHVCSLCKFSFVNRSVLTRHINSLTCVIKLQQAKQAANESPDPLYATSIMHTMPNNAIMPPTTVDKKEGIFNDIFDSVFDEVEAPLLTDPLDHSQPKQERMNPLINPAPMKRLNKPIGVNIGRKPAIEDIHFECHVCNLPFQKKFDLKMHLQIHSEAQTYGCNFCKKCFLTISRRNRHIKEVHTVVIPGSPTGSLPVIKANKAKFSKWRRVVGAGGPTASKLLTELIELLD